MIILSRAGRSARVSARGRPSARRARATRLLGSNAQIRKSIKTRGHFPSDEAAAKLIWLALRNVTAEWKRSSIYWKVAVNNFAILLYAERFTKLAE